MIDLSQIKNQLAGRGAGILKQEGAMDSAIILPLVKVNEELRVLFEVRAHHLRRQPSEICFPGGRIDSSDPTPEMAAIRELTEELGVDKSAVNVFAPLDILVTPFRGIIYPFVAKLTDIDSICVNTEEVDHIFTVPLSFLYNYEPERFSMGIRFEPGKNFPLDKISNKRSYSSRINLIPELFYYYNDYVIWGITARILSHFLDITKPKST
ncbi:CoA pyrophosphatase [bacterium LRH843]|nr:CoA pyrophosphatase [bacterium LRH843]